MVVIKKIFLFLFIILLINNAAASNKITLKKIHIIELKGMINSVMESYLLKEIILAEKDNAAVILTIDTPGGMLESTRNIILKIINSNVPVIGYVYPEGARAASAGVFIMLGCDKAVMSRYTHIGAAHPVSIGKKMDKIMEQKIMNDTIAFITGLAEKHHKNKTIAVAMIKKSISITAYKALKNNLIDFIADNIGTLLEKIKYIRKNDKLYFINPEKIIRRKMNIFEKFLFKISNPNLAYILLILGIYGILAEFSSPGIGFPGVFGGISLLLAFVALNTLPINIVGVILIIVGAVLLILELNIQSGGILGIGSIISIILGSVMLMKSIRISPYLILGAVLFTILIFLLLLTLSVKASKRKPVTGREELISNTGVAKTDITPIGTVFIEGELWKAKSFNNQQIKKGDEIEVVDIKNLLLIVKKIGNKE